MKHTMTVTWESNVALGDLALEEVQPALSELVRDLVDREAAYLSVILPALEGPGPGLDLLDACQYFLGWCGLPLLPNQQCTLCQGPSGGHLVDCPAARIQAAVARAT